MSDASRMLVVKYVGTLRQDIPIGVEVEDLGFFKKPNHPWPEIIGRRNTIRENDHDTVSARSSMALGLGHKSFPMDSFQKMQTPVSYHEIMRTSEPILLQIANTSRDMQTLAPGEGIKLRDGRLGDIYRFHLVAVPGEKERVSAVTASQIEDRCITRKDARQFDQLLARRSKRTRCIKILKSTFPKRQRLHAQ